MKDTWRESTMLSIRSSNILPDFIKRYVLGNWWWIRVVFFPFLILGRVFSFLTVKSEASPDGNSHSDKKTPIDKKSDIFGYATSVVIAIESREEIKDRLLLKELSGAMNIFSHPDGNSFSMRAGVMSIRYRDLRIGKPKSSHILNTVELAGLVHMPTLYVKTPGINWVLTRRFEPPHNLPDASIPHTPLGHTNFR